MDKPFLEKLAKQLKRIRKEKNLTQDDIGVNGISRAMISLIELAKTDVTASKLKMTSELLESNELTLQSRKAEISEVDLPSAISQLVQQNYALQASMQAYSIISNQSLLDYI